MQTIIFLIGLAILGFVLYVNLMRYNYNYFQKCMRVGDHCKFYKGEVACFGEIIDIYEGKVILQNAYGLNEVNKVDVYPVTIKF